MFFTCFQDKEIYRWPIKESIKAMLAWEWTVEKARDGEGEAEKKAATRKISQTAQVKEKAFLTSLNVVIEHKRLKDNTIKLAKLMMPYLLYYQATYDPSHGYSPQPIDISGMALSRELQVCIFLSLPRHQ